MDRQGSAAAGRHGDVGISYAPESEAAGRLAVRAALDGRPTTDADLVIIFAGSDYELDALYQGAVNEAAPAQVVGCTATGAFTHDHQVEHGCVAVLLSAEGRRFGVCHREYDAEDVAGSARSASRIAQQRAGESHPHSVLLLLTDGLAPDQREMARGAYEVTGAATPFVGGAAADRQLWECTHTFGEGQVLSHGILAVWINSSLPMSVSVGHGWRPAGRPMLATRTIGTVVRELDGVEALAAYLAEVPDEIVRALTPGSPEFFRAVLENPVGIPNARGRYDVRQLHAYLPQDGGLNFNTGISENSILQVMNSTDELLLDGARRAADCALQNLEGAPRLALVFSCGSRMPLLGDRVAEEAQAISAALGGVPVCGFFTFGEFARVNGSGGVHNASVAILVL